MTLHGVTTQYSLFLTYLTLKMETLHPSETSVNHQSTRRNNPHNLKLHQHIYENLKYRKLFLILLR
jgi:hypothetical protein